MSLMKWFSRKPVRQPWDDSADFAEPAATPAPKAAAPKAPPSERKSERVEQREHLYSVVRETLTGVGILSSSYKFKVLSLDARGQQYLIMVDLTRQYGGDANRLAEIEALISNHASTRYDISVSAVYWRINDLAAAGVPRQLQAMPTPGAGQEQAAKPRSQAIGADEIAAFKQAVAAPAAAAPVGEVIHSARRNPTPDFEDTELDYRHPPLSGTQYGDLN